MALLKAYAVSLGLFLVLDFIWLGYVMKSFNLRQLAQIGRIENGQFDLMMAPAVVAYLMMTVFMVFFILPRVSESSFLASFLIGALGGLLVYGIFDMTNMAILKDYPFTFALVDMAWGSVLFGTVTVIVKKFV